MRIVKGLARKAIGCALTSGLLLAGAAVAAPAASAAAAPANSVPVPGTGLYFGASIVPASGQTAVSAYQDLITQSGSSFGLHRTYQQWTSAPISATTQWDADHGLIPAVSVKPAGSWVDVANGSLDADINKQADAWKAWGKPVLLTFHHEPEDDTPARGTPQDFVNAWRHYVQVFRDRGVTNVSWDWIMMSWSFNLPSPTRADAFYPGDAYVDWLGVDGYNWYGCKTNAKWMTFKDVMASFRAWAANHPGKPIIVAETGTQEGAAAGDKGQWIQDMMTTLKGWPQVKGLAYFDIAMDGCNWPLNSSTSSMDGWKTIAADSYSHATATVQAPPAVGTLTATPTTNGATLTGTVDPKGAATTYTVDYGPTTAYGTTTPAANAGTTAGPTPVTTTVTNLTPGTYHARLSATNSAGTVSTPDITFTVQAPPAVGTLTATPTTNGATLTGTVDPKGAATTYTVDYGPTTAYGTTTPAANAGTTAGPTPVTTTVTNLTPGTYHARLSATNSAGTVSTPDITFTVQAPPAVGTLTATPTTNGATLTGTVDPKGAATTYTVDYGPTTAYGTTTPAANAGTTAGPTPVTTTVTNLTPGTYHARLSATNSAGTVSTPDITFTVQAPPAVGTLTATPTTNGATLTGTVDPKGAATTYTVDYGPTTAYGTTTPAANAGTTAGPTPVTTTVTNLTPGTYHARLSATNSAGTVSTPDITFTVGQAPAATTMWANGILTTGVSLYSGINPHGLATTFQFQYGATTAYGSTSAATTAGTTEGQVTLYQRVKTPLAAKTTYHFRVVATNAAGISYGTDGTFKTS